MAPSVAARDFVNAGVLSESQLTNLTSAFFLSQSGATLSNTAAGQLLTEAGGTGTFRINRDFLLKASYYNRQAYGRLDWDQQVAVQAVFQHRWW